jgi:hypothetical protein
MKLPRFPAAVLATAILACGADFAPWAGAQESPAHATVKTPPPAAEKVLLSSAAEDVLKLAKAKINDDVTLAFIQNHERRYSLSAGEILHLRKEGVSDRILTAMLNHGTGAGGISEPDVAPTGSPPPEPAPEASAPQSATLPEATTVVETAPSAIYLATTPAFYSFYDPWPYWYDPWPYWNPCYSVGFYWGWGGSYWNPVGYRGNYCHRGDPPPHASNRPPPPGGAAFPGRGQPPPSNGGGRTESRFARIAPAGMPGAANRGVLQSAITTAGSTRNAMRPSASVNTLSGRPTTGAVRQSTAPSFRSSATTVGAGAAVRSSRPSSPTATTFRSIRPSAYRPSAIPSMNDQRSGGFHSGYSYRPSSPALSIGRPSMPSSFGGMGGRSEFRGGGGFNRPAAMPAGGAGRASGGPARTR